MTIQTKNPPAGGADGLVELYSLAANNSTVAQSSTENQANIRADELRGCLIREISHIIAIGLPRRRLSVRINVLDGRAPYGRSRAFRLAESDIDELIAVAARMERLR
jgi:hypothetical protein